MPRDSTQQILEVAAPDESTKHHSPSVPWAALRESTLQTSKSATLRDPTSQTR